MSRRILWVSCLTAIGLFALDRITRALAFAKPAGSILPRILRSEPLWNSGVAFGLRLPGALITVLLGALILAVAFLAYSALRHHDAVPWWASLIVFVGATSNVLDRLQYGAVRDFLRLSFWPTTGNLGDWMITFGAIALLVSTFRKPHTPPT